MRFGGMKSRSVMMVLLAAGTAGAAMAQESQPVQLRPDAVPQTSTPAMNVAPLVQPGAPAPVMSPEYLQQLTGTIALYPDPLVAQILPASTFPTEIVMAARMVERGGGGASPEEIDKQPWDASVKAIAHYPTVIKMMSDNLEWTAALGDAFMKQPAEVMAAIQVLRLKAKSLGNLVDTPQQKVLEEGAVVRIVPAVPEVVYVPVYQTSVVFTTASPWGWGWPGFFVGFGTGWALGTWCNLDCNWWRGCCYRPWGWNWCGFRCGVTNINCGPGSTTWNHNVAPGAWTNGAQQAWSRDLSKPLTRGIGADRAVARPPMAMDSVGGLTLAGKPASAAPGVFNGGAGVKPASTTSGLGGKPVTTPGVGPEGVSSGSGAASLSKPTAKPGSGAEGVSSRGVAPSLSKPVAVPTAKPGAAGGGLGVEGVSGSKPAAMPSGKPAAPSAGPAAAPSAKPTISRPSAVLSNGATVHAPAVGAGGGYGGYSGKPAAAGGERVAPSGGGMSKPMNAAPAGGGGGGSGMSKPVGGSPAPARFSMPAVPGASRGDSVSVGGTGSGGKIGVPSTAASGGMSRSSGSYPASVSRQSGGSGGGYSRGGYSGGGGKIATSPGGYSGGARSMGGSTYSGRGGGFTSRGGGGGGFSGGGGGMRGGGGGGKR